MNDLDTEADTCRKVITPRLQAVGWERSPHQIQEQRIITPGRILFAKGGTRRGRRKRLDYLLRYAPDVPIAVVEAKASYKTAAEGMQQAKLYASMLGVKFAYATNGADIFEFDAFTGVETKRPDFPPPAELWDRQKAGLALKPEGEEIVLTPGRPDPEQPLRYYQEAAVLRAVESIAAGRRRTLLTLCTGAGKTPIAFHIAWRLHQARWTAMPGRLRARILFLADRDVLVKDPQNRHFAPFGEGRHRILGGRAPGSREVFFATYQALLGEGPDATPFAGLPRDFFDLIIVDECHRGSSRDESAWRTILTHFSAAAQLGMTATPLHEDARDTYAYFGTPLYTYSLRQGIDDGYLAPYKVRRVVTDFDATGWRPTAGELDRFGQEIPDEEYQTKDFERVVALRARTEAIARHLTDFLRATDPYAKTLVFCVDQEHADEMRRALSNLNADLMARDPDWVCRVTADEGDVGRTHLDHFQDIDQRTPTILTTSQMLTTGVDAPTVRNVVLARVIGSMSEFKQIIGRGTRVREDYGKTWFTILDYTGTATAKFADPDFDGDPVAVTIDTIDPETGATTSTEDEPAEDQSETGDGAGEGGVIPPGDGVGEGGVLPPGGGGGGGRIKYYVDSGEAEIVVDIETELDGDGKLVTRRVVEKTSDIVRTLYPTPIALRTAWGLPDKRRAVAEALAARGLDVSELAEAAGQPDADPFDLLCHVAWGTPPRTRRERAEALKRRKPAVFERFGDDARAVLDALLDRYEAGGPDELDLPEALKIGALSAMGNTSEIAARFGGPDKLREAVIELQQEIYAA
ncbi:EcoAI/FtnUII family type I restriction enzme subunit R [Rubrimonas cliftonensis]|uniref:Type I restriction enzyme, R subunit n=1 Tax=Rubrimonas cliftonensis TaxID=89524 RepID=A0A1H4FY73_9RHOB|nr:DEAD/DEAH box helicase family protein [Rubrimonas cliftonensis]SEB02293.1 type I restriction enzyme, R subunit [Rubrimonas cliftonensis]